MQARKALSGICFPKSISLGMQQSVRNKYKILKIKIRKGPSFLCFSTQILDFRDSILV
jgi:hypothetical protein